MGFFSNDNPNAWAGDPNNQFYQVAMLNFFNNLRKNLNASSPGTQQLLSSQMAQGGDFGGSTYIAGKQREDILAKNNDVAGTAATNFGANLYGHGMDIYAQGQEFAKSSPTFLDQLLEIGGGIAGIGVGNIFSGKSFFGGNKNTVAPTGIFNYNGTGGGGTF